MAAAIDARWGPPEQDPMVRQGRFMIAGLRLGRVFVGIQPARALGNLGVADYASYHDAELVPPHSYLAFYFWLRDAFAIDAVVHVGKHGNLEWLPGKSLALSQACWPDAILGPLPNVYPFIVNDPGEGAQAKRRTQAVIVDHLMPPLTRAETTGRCKTWSARSTSTTTRCWSTRAAPRCCARRSSRPCARSTWSKSWACRARKTTPCSRASMPTCAS
jgi:cobaltochelatase CobN